jgi:hypothetical protein
MVSWLPDPYLEGDGHALWQHARDPSITFQPELIRPRMHQPSLLRQNAADAWREWATGVQDDHGFICKTLNEF